ncbi:MAG: hypothetical protein HY619_07915 [Thaumarchaeota archaeon]|nr:hypothetical protein [Nitrososphaerota archaeon]
MAQKVPKHSAIIGITLLAVIVSSAAGLGYYQYVWLPSAVAGETIPPEILNPPQNVTVSLVAGAYVPSQVENFVPKNITVVLSVNNTVIWSMEDTVAHTVTSVGRTPSPKFDETAITSNFLFTEGDRFIYTFTNPGVYNYYCVPHSAWMRGTVTVLPAPSQLDEQSVEHG